MHGRMARYTYTGDVQELAQKAEEGLLPIFQSQPGFKAYSVISSGDEIVSFSAWETAEQAGAANTAASEWVAENLRGRFRAVRDEDRGDSLLDDARRQHESRRARLEHSSWGRAFARPQRLGQAPSPLRARDRAAASRATLVRRR